MLFKTVQQQESLRLRNFESNEIEIAFPAKTRLIASSMLSDPQSHYCR
jgi:hypothetical protein